MAEPNQNGNRKEVTITRIFDAPPELVFKAWTDPTLVAQWWGPKGFTNAVCEFNVLPGGSIRIDMRGPDGVVYPMKGIFHEIVKPERIVLTTSAFEDKEGNPLLSAQYRHVRRTGRQDEAHLTCSCCQVGTRSGASARRYGGWLEAKHRSSSCTPE